MSKLAELLEGVEVEWRPLARHENAIAELCRGRVMSKSYLEENKGVYPVYSSQTANNGEIGKIQTFDFDGESITWTTDGANAGTVFHRTGKFSITNVCGLIKILETNKLNYRFLFYWLSIEAKKHVYSGMGNPKLMSHQMEKIQIPIPYPENLKKSLEIQKEIVRLLDTFTERTETLINELTTELESRKKQYNYYRERLLTFKMSESGFAGFQNLQDKVEWKTLGEVCDLLTGFPFDSSQFKDKGTKLMRGINIKRGILSFNENDDRYWGNISGLEKYLLQKDDIVISMDGSLVGKSFGIIEEINLPLILVQRVARIRSASADVNIKYVYFCITNWFFSYVEQKKTQGAIPHISQKDISSFKIPIPPKEEQARIVSILDKFDTLTASISEALPKEIALRKKQYEYYRDLLLTFPKDSLNA